MLRLLPMADDVRSAKREGGMTRSAKREGGMTRSAKREGGMTRSAKREGGMTRSAKREGGMTRTVTVRSPSVWRETGYVARAVAHVIVWTAALMGASFTRGEQQAAAGQPTVALDEVAFGTLDAGAQRMYRSCLDALAEAEATRGKSGAWPTVEQLVAKNLAPFLDPLDKAGYRWTLLNRGGVFDYVGVPDASSGRPTFLINVVEPEPGMVVDVGLPSDETHHRLRDGTMLHVGVWSVPGARQLDTAVPTPAFEDGWRRITMGGP